MARPRTFDEAEVVAAAQSQFWDQGYLATSVDDLTEVTGLGKGSLYGAFGDKRTLFLRALDTYRAASDKRMSEELCDPTKTAFERLSTHAHNAAARVVADTRRRGCMLSRTAAEFGNADVEVERTVAKSLRLWRSRLSDCIAEAQRDGDVRADVDPEAMATMLQATLRGLEAMRRAGLRPGQVSAAAEQALVLLAA